MAIIYKSILGQLKAAGYTTTRLRRERLLPEGTIQRIRDGRPITTDTINEICNLLRCQPNDILEHVQDEDG